MVMTGTGPKGRGLKDIWSKIRAMSFREVVFREPLDVPLLDVELRHLRQECATFSNSIIKALRGSPANGTYLERQTISRLSYTDVWHRLGRRPRGYLVVKLYKGSWTTPGAFAVDDTHADLENKLLLRAIGFDADPVVDLWIIARSGDDPQYQQGVSLAP